MMEPQQIFLRTRSHILNHTAILRMILRGIIGASSLCAVETYALRVCLIVEYRQPVATYRAVVPCTRSIV